MHCLFCVSKDTQVLETRMQNEGRIVRRRRLCSECDRRFTTIENAELRYPVIVKRDGRRSEYDKEKIRQSFKVALKKRKVPEDAVEKVIESLEVKLLDEQKREIPSSLIGEWVMAALKEMDQVGYVRFASVYRNFEDLSDFRKLINNKLVEKNNPQN